VPELVSDAVRLAECAGEEVPRLAAEKVEEERFLPLDSGEKVGEEPLVPARAAAVSAIAGVDGVVAVAGADLVEKLGRLALDPEVAVVKPPLEQVDPVEARRENGLRLVDDGDTPPRLARDRPVVEGGIDLVVLDRPEPRLTGVELARVVEVGDLPTRAGHRDLRPDRAR
jgi:hypothetical protein